MVQVQSKLAPIANSCAEYVHPWTDSCLEALAGLYLYCIFDSFRIYCTVYLLTLLMKGRIPTKKDVKRTIHGILQSTAFLSATGFGYTLFLCQLRKLFGNFNILTVSAIPAFLASVFAILIERPSRRALLCLYVSNVATETVWNMLLSRNLVRPIKYGQVAIFSTCIAALLTFYKNGKHLIEGKSDSMFSVLRFVVGPYEEKNYSQTSTDISRHDIPNNPSTSGWSRNKSQNKNVVFHLISQALRVYKKIIHKIKCSGRDSSCPHPFSCIYYCLQGTGKMFSIGLGIQTALKLVLNMKKIFTSPSSIKNIFFKRDILSLGAFLGGFAGVFRMVMCILRRSSGTDNPYFALPAGLLAGLAFTQYPDTTVSLYVLWKMAQITYNLGIEKGIVPKIPGFTEFLYCLSTATLFHAAILEPSNLRPSYWKFLFSISGGRIACMNRIPLDVWGLNTSSELLKTLKRTNTVPQVNFYGCSV